MLTELLRLCNWLVYEHYAFNMCGDHFSEKHLIGYILVGSKRSLQMLILCVEIMK